MKRMTHPQLVQSMVQWKDGSLYSKWWLYFRPVLHVEMEVEKHLVWKKASEAIRNSVTKRTLKKTENVND